jgi:5-hydroxyisourate hydrolase
MSGISTHVLDTSLGRPAAGLPVVLELETSAGKWKELRRAATDADGRIGHLLPPGDLIMGTYRLTFDTASYSRANSLPEFYPQVAVTFTVRDPKQHHHIPLLLSPYGYSTYRGS